MAGCLQSILNHTKRPALRNIAPITSFTGVPPDCSEMRLSGRDRRPMVQQHQKQQREKLPTAQGYGASDPPFSV